MSMHKKLVFFFFIIMSIQLSASTVDTLKFDFKVPKGMAPEDYMAIRTLTDTLGVLSYAIVNDSLEANRFASCRQFIPTLVKALKHKNSFKYPFEKLQTLSVQYPADSTFRVFTWQLYVDKDTYHYYGAIQMNNEDLKLFPLTDRSDDMEDPQFEVVDNKNWYGSVYYNIRQFDTEEGRKYLMFGYDGHSFFNKRKIIDVLSFKDGQCSFGAPVFVRSEDSKNHPPTMLRKIMEYSADAMVSLRYDEVHEIILFDHLYELATSERLYQIPDGTYEGYKLQNGKWMHIEKAFHEMLDEAPRPEPVFKEASERKTKRKDIFGNK